jgi:hypothetical protein
MKKKEAQIFGVGDSGNAMDQLTGGLGQVMNDVSKVDDANAEVTLEFDDPGQPPITFEIDDVPGAPEAQEIEVEDNGDIEVEDNGGDGDVEVENDPWNWQGRGIGQFLQWVQEMLSNTPQHSGYDTTGLEKAIAYFEAIDREITKAMRQDYRNEIDSAGAERARETIEKGLESLVDRLEKVKSSKYKRHAKKTQKKGETETDGIVKEAQKSTSITGITITVPLFISGLARVCVNGMVSAGHDLEELYHDQVKEYDLTKREQAELRQLLLDMGLALRLDRGYIENSPNSLDGQDGRDWAKNYAG